MSIELALIPIAIALAGAVSTRAQQELADANSYALGTKMRNPRLLQQALEQYGCSSVVTEEAVDVTFQGENILFAQNEDGVFEAIFRNRISHEQANTFLDHIHEEYTQLVQQEVYQKLISRAQDRGLILETEEVMQDNSILLTFQIGGR